MTAPLILNLPGNIPMAFRHIPPGRCRIGWRHAADLVRQYPWIAGEAPHLVLDFNYADFWLAETPVTQAQWRVVMGKEPKNEAHTCGDARPVVHVTWSEVLAFIDALAVALPFGTMASLPSEFEWEYCCRAGTESDYWNGDGSDALEDVAWYGANSGGRLHDVGEKPANPWGLYDMHGNAWEWTATACATANRSSLLPCILARHVVREMGGTSADWHIERGGCYLSDPDSCHSSYRFARHIALGHDRRGFRICLLRNPACPGAATERRRGDTIRLDESSFGMAT